MMNLVVTLMEDELLNNEPNFSFKTQDLKKVYVSGETVVHALRGINVEIP